MLSPLQEVLVFVTALRRFFVVCVFYYIVLPILRAIPRKYVPKKIPSTYLKAGTLNVNRHTFFQMIRKQRIAQGGSAKIGKEAPDFDVVTLEGVNKKLFDFKRDGRMLVVSFGSNT